MNANDNSALTRETQVTEAVEQALRSDKRTAPYTIEVEMQGTTVSLRGRVESQQDKEAAESVARGVSGVINVTNELVIESGVRGLFGLGGGDDRMADGAPLGVPLPAAPGGTGSAPTVPGGGGYIAPLLALDESAAAPDRDAEGE